MAMNPNLEPAPPTTIVGVATGRPDGGVAIVRLSGPAARTIATAMLTAELPEPRVAALRRLVLGEQALVLDMPGPRSFTGEDVVELHVHGGERNVGQVVEAALAAGASPAGPGDFTRRAFEHGRLSLDQAEGIAAIIGAQTQGALDQARRLVAGELGRAVEAVHGRLRLLRVEVEANLDFPEDVSAADEARFAETAASLRAEIEGWLARFEGGRRARERARVVLAGPPNAGKSSLFNALLGRARALVSPTAGTTRDFVEAELELERSVALVDTAGLREASEDAIELAGVALGQDQLAGADVVIWLEGADQPALAEAERQRWLAGADTATVIPVLAKADLDSPRTVEGWLSLSAHTGAGLDDLRRALADAVRPGEQWIGLARHRQCAAEAVEALGEVEAQLREGLGLELVAFSLAVAQTRLGAITGHTGLGPVGEEVLHAIFSSFCIGK